MRKTLQGRGSAIAKRSLSQNGKVRQGFGSFHSKDIEDLIGENSDAPPSMKVLHENFEGFTSARLDNFRFGKQAQDLFLLDPQWTFLNHGAFGAVLQPLTLASQHWRMQCERQPLQFFDRDLFPLVSYSLRKAAKFFNCSPRELYPLQNVTTGLNILLQSLQLVPGDEVICFSLTYGSTKKMLKDKCERSGATLRIVELPLPVSDSASVVQALQNALSDKTRMVIIDHVTSNTAMVLPVLEMAKAARAAGALVVVDAAHAMLSQPVSIYPIAARPNSASNSGTTSELCIAEVADVWLTNGHKWLSAPKGCAFMWVHPAAAPHLRPAVVSHGFQSYLGDGSSSTESTGDALQYARDYSKLRWWHDKACTGVVTHSGHIPPSKLLSALVWDGCRDYSALLCVPSALDLWQALPAFETPATSKHPKARSAPGVAAVRAYTRHLLHDQVVPMLTQEWGLTEADFAAPLEMRQGSPMVLVSCRAVPAFAVFDC